MKFQVGDKVLVTLTNEEGEVVDIINEKMVMVEVRKVKFPAYVDQLDFPYFKRFTQGKLVQEKKPVKKYIDQVPKEKAVTQAPANLPKGVWLTFLPTFIMDEFGDDIVRSVKIHLINGTEWGFNFHFKLNYFGKADMELKNQLYTKQDFYLIDIDFEDFNDNPSFDCEFSLITADKKKAEYFETSLKLKAKQVFAKIEEIKQKGHPTFSYQLFEEYPDKAVEDTIDMGRLAAKGYKVYEASRSRQHLPPPRSVIDLHMEKITDNWKGLSNFEILSMQMKEFEKFYELAVLHMQPSLVVIHGVGSGRLRDEIHEALKQKKEVRYFVNQYHPSYGYGATEIFFQY